MLTVSSSDAELLRDLMQHEQFQSNLDPELRVWLTDQKSKNLFEAARLADQYVPVQKADRPVYKGQESSSKGRVTKPRSFGVSGHSTTSGGFQKSASFGHNAKPHTEQKPSATTAGINFTQREKDMALGLCFQCKKHRHIRSACPKLRAEREQKDAPVQLILPCLLKSLKVK